MPGDWGVERHARRTGILWGMVVLGAIYSSLLFYLQTITGTHTLDGSLGILIGLYISSHPAANAVDLLFAGRHTSQELPSGWSGLGWLALNVVVLLIGWFVTVIGATRLFG